MALTFCDCFNAGIEYAKGSPNSLLTFGQDTFTSIKSIGASQIISATSANSSGVPAKILPINGASVICLNLVNSFTPSATLGLDNPTALIKKCSVLVMVGLGCPVRASFETDLTVTPPQPLSTARFRLAAVKPKMPEARTIGLEKFFPRNEVDNIIRFRFLFPIATK